jgi:hypothetical protein
MPLSAKIHALGTKNDAGEDCKGNLSVYPRSAEVLYPSFSSADRTIASTSLLRTNAGIFIPLIVTILCKNSATSRASNQSRTHPSGQALFAALTEPASCDLGRSVTILCASNAVPLAGGSRSRFSPKPARYAGAPAAAPNQMI